MLSGSKLSKSFWDEALATAVYVKNRSPANSLKVITPYEHYFETILFLQDMIQDIHKLHWNIIHKSTGVT